MPIQRIPRYVLLMNELLKKTEMGHRDYMNIKHALEEVEKIAFYINEKKRMYDNQEMVQKIQERFSPKDPPFLKENRSSCMESILYLVDPEFEQPKNPLKKKKHKEPSFDQLGLMECQFFVFTDMVLCGLQQKQYLIQKKLVKYLEMISIDTQPNLSVPFYDLVEIWKCFALVSSQGIIEKFYTNNAELYEKLLKTMQEAMIKENETKLQELQRKQTKMTTIL